MPVLNTAIRPESAEFAANQAANLALLDELNKELDRVRAGGGERYVQRHRARGRLLIRERIELLVDPDTPFLELSSLTAWGTQFTPGATLVTGIGVVSGVPCMLLGHDATVRGGTLNPFTFRKHLRALEIAREYRIPVISLVESGGADLPTAGDLFIPSGAVFREMTQASAEGIPQISLVFGNATAGGAYIPGMSDYTVMIDQQSHVYLAGPPLVKMATGEDADDEQLGGALMHGQQSGVSDYVARDERDCLRICRQIMSHFSWAPPVPLAGQLGREPAYDPGELLGIASSDPRQPFDMHEIVARIVDRSEFDSFKPLYGSQLVTGWARIYGRQVGIIGNNGVLFSAEAEKATQFVQLCNQIGCPIIFLQNTTGFMVGTSYEQTGITKNGAKMINAVANSKVPHFTVLCASSYGAGNFAMMGRSIAPRLLFSWPNSRTAVMGPQQLAGVMSIVRRAAAAARGEPYDEDEDQRLRAELEAQVEQESLALTNTAKLHDDGIIDPRDTRTVLGFALQLCPLMDGVRSTYGVYRM